MSPAVDREGSKWDRAARLLRVATVLHAHPAGISAQAIADQIGVSKRTVYRDLIAMELDADLPIWQDKGKWGLEFGRLPASSRAHPARGDDLLPGRPGAGEGDR